MLKKNLNSLNQWTYKGKPILEIPNSSIGFTYVISCIDMNSPYYGYKYWGMKVFHFNKTVKLGKRALAARTDKRTSTKKKVTTESDWLTYTSSCKELKELMQKNPSGFSREILGFYSTTKRLAFAELTLLIQNQVLFRPDCFNSNILGKFFKKDFHDKS